MRSNIPERLLAAAEIIHHLIDKWSHISDMAKGIRFARAFDHLRDFACENPEHELSSSSAKIAGKLQMMIDADNATIDFCNEVARSTQDLLVHKLMDYNIQHFAEESKKWNHSSR